MFIVIDENSLCYTHNQAPNSVGVLGSNVHGYDPKNGPIAMPMDKSRIRRATREDWDTFRVSPKGHLWDDACFRKLTHLAGVTTVMRELLAENDELQAMLEEGQPEADCVQFINENW